MDRAQAHTLEAFTTAMLLVTGVVFALQATAVTPLTASTSNQHIENQEHAMANDLLEATDSNETLEAAVVFWNESGEKFSESGETSYYIGSGPPNEFGKVLNETFVSNRIAFNVYVEYSGQNGSVKEQTMVYMGAASDNAVSATNTVVLYDDTELTGVSAGMNVSAATEFYAPDVDSDGELYNVLEVRIVVWQM